MIRRARSGFFLNDRKKRSERRGDGYPSPDKTVRNEKVTAASANGKTPKFQTSL